jgi:hypothetical protein
MVKVPDTFSGTQKLSQKAHGQKHAARAQNPAD